MIEATSNRFGLDRFIPNGVIQFFKSRERLQLEETMRLLEEDIRLDEMDLAEFVFTRGERDPGSPTLIKYHVPVHGAKQRLGYTVTVQDHEQSKGFGDFVTSAHPMKGIELDLNTGIFRKCTYAHIGQERTQLFQFTQFNEEGEKVFYYDRKEQEIPHNVPTPLNVLKKYHAALDAARYAISDYLTP